MKKGELWTIAKDLDELPNGLRFLLAGRLREFGKEYGLRLQTIGKELKKVQEDYCEHDPVKDHPDRREMRVRVEGGRTVPVLKEGKTMQEYQKALQDLFEQDVTHITLAR